MKRGDVWTVERFGHERSVVIVGNDATIGDQNGVLVVPLSDVLEPKVGMPGLNDSNGTPLGTFLFYRVGSIDKKSLRSRTAVLGDASRHFADVALRAAFDI
ncbi:hypothetical protein [Actinoplanes couchii]|uniref:Transcriptional modulator of MazE/toxin, MazF n=1 Tax=Actinoplanes couchii TaxID=403638 RepID=A0ABQ3XAF6_9ACTN|nr:hypothetical protein [Actinoplanes couchii]MDR6324918.1 mRNA-degrading endonuclease toxin of MazEF toxin-antitoxin module [Actinoplanes couchii]GID55461.1 hypothetical protein Aco03nite_038650 [Actinoplanes couchii]